MFYNNYDNNPVISSVQQMLFLIFKAVKHCMKAEVLKSLKYEAERLSSFDRDARKSFIQ